MAEILDKTILLDLAGDDFASFIPIIDDFDKNGQKLLHEISQGVANSDLSAVKAAAHQLKGSSGMLGMQKLYETCKEIETLELSEIDKSLLQKFNECFESSVSAAREALT